jgi:hypothetical protein
MNDPVLLLAFLLASHLTADFVIQTDASVAGRNGSRLEAARSLGLHGLAVAACMLPFWLAFGTPGLLALLVVAVPHPFIDWAKSRLTRRLAEAPAARDSDLEWSPRPAMLFLLDQAAHVALLVGAWWVLLRDAAVNPWFTEQVARATAEVAAPDVGRAALAAAVVWSLLVVNTRAARCLVALILPPDGAGAELGAAAGAKGGYTVKLGPLSGRIEQDRPTISPEPDKVGAAVGVLERLLVVALILGRADAGIGLVVAAKTLARFKQLEERRFAEKYLVGTLASIGIAVATSLLARAVLVG